MQIPRFSLFLAYFKAILSSKKIFYEDDFTQLFSANAKMFLKSFKILFAPENMKKPPSKVAYNRPRPFFSVLPIGLNPA